MPQYRMVQSSSVQIYCTLVKKKMPLHDLQICDTLEIAWTQYALFERANTANKVQPNPHR